MRRPLASIARHDGKAALDDAIIELSSAAVGQSALDRLERTSTASCDGNWHEPRSGALADRYSNFRFG